MAGSPILQFIRQVAEDPEVRDLPDLELLQRFHRHHEEAAFRTLVRRHGALVLDVCRAVLGNGPDAEDAFQATFLVLARKPDSIRKGASLASWLHGVAHRTALRMRTRCATRTRHEARAPVRADVSAAALTWAEVRQVLHEELGHIPARYRDALVLCYLEGATHQAAAARLGLGERTVRERLERGRALLRARLLRRGLGPAALLVVATVPLALPALALACGVVRAATLIVSGQRLTEVVLSPAVVTLIEEVMKTMVVSKLKLVTLVVAVLSCGAAFVGATTRYAGSAVPEPQHLLVVAEDGPAQVKPDAEPAPDLVPLKTKPGAGPGFGDGVQSRPLKVKPGAGPGGPAPAKTKPGAGPGGGAGKMP